MQNRFPPARFQSFNTTSDATQSKERVSLLRKEMELRGWAGFIVPRSDEHQSEYVPKNNERMAWLTGFTGSAGNAIILQEKAALIVDGRYTLQAQQQTDSDLISIVQLADMTAEQWLARNMPSGGVIAYDPWLHTAESYRKLNAAVTKSEGRLEAVTVNPIDSLWQNRPPAPATPIHSHPVRFAGEDLSSKLQRIQEKLLESKIEYLVVSDPHNIAWTFNIRANDVSHTPLPLGYALIPAKGRATLFFDPSRLSSDVSKVLSIHADTLPSSQLLTVLDDLGSKAAIVRIDSATGAFALVQRIEAAGGTADIGDDPITLMKAVKNATEIAGAKAAHIRDGAAVTRFLHWLVNTAQTTPLTEIDTVNALEAFRVETGCLKDISFTTIAGAGPHAALPHYRVSTDSNAPLKLNDIYLVDSGGQYEDGTTDITRTVIIGEPTNEMKDRFTRVLKGHIAIARAVFPVGTSGAQIDMLARQPLWQAGLDFDHGTGHGIGSYLSVHEGPQRIAKIGNAPLQPGMLLSNEPGYYKVNFFGIRIENLILVEERRIEGAERSMLGFETISFVPIDLKLVEPSLLNAEEKAWLNAYHAKVRELIGPELDEKTRNWLENVTADI